jgi:hypothetical protein
MLGQGEAMKIAYWQIRNRHDECFCQRGTLRECRELLAKYATEPPTFKGWSDGPYTIWRVTEKRRLTHRPRPTQAKDGAR